MGKTAGTYSKLVTVVLRIIVGLVFIFSGIVKEIDPWGFYFKISEYLAAWDMECPRNMVQFAAVVLPMVEFTAGVMLLAGAFRRVVTWVLAAFMAVMLPLTAYIWIADPVSDCGCFGDALVIGNGTTFFKNVFLSAAVVWLIIKNRNVRCWIAPQWQWIAVVGCMAYCMIIANTGWNVQPVLDFRSYKTGTEIVSEDSEADMRFVYERDGVKHEFGIDELPDSTWTFVERIEEAPVDDKTFAVFDGDDDVTADVIETEGKQLILLISDPVYHSRRRAALANEMYRVMEESGGSMICVVATSPDRLDEWKRMTRPEYPVYTSDATAMRVVARGDAAVVYLVDGKIRWKRNLMSLPSHMDAFTENANTDEDTAEVYDSIEPIDNGKFFRNLTIALAVLLIALVLMSHPWTKLRKTVKNKGEVLQD